MMFKISFFKWNFFAGAKKAINMKEIHRPVLTALLRGARGRCPRCGKGRLLQQYLKTVKCCSVCGEPLGHLPADDMPPWMTILLVGYITVPSMVLLNHKIPLETSVQLTIWIPIILILTLLLLPRCKGFILAILWILNK